MHEEKLRPSCFTTTDPISKSKMWCNKLPTRKKLRYNPNFSNPPFFEIPDNQNLTSLLDSNLTPIIFFISANNLSQFAFLKVVQKIRIPLYSKDTYHSTSRKVMVRQFIILPIQHFFYSYSVDKISWCYLLKVSSMVKCSTCKIMEPFNFGGPLPLLGVNGWHNSLITKCIMGEHHIKMLLQ